MTGKCTYFYKNIIFLVQSRWLIPKVFGSSEFNRK